MVPVQIAALIFTLTTTSIEGYEFKANVIGVGCSWTIADESNGSICDRELNKLIALQQAVFAKTVCKRVSFKDIIFPLKSSAQQYTLYTVSALRPVIVTYPTEEVFTMATCDPDNLIFKTEVMIIPSGNEAQWTVPGFDIFTLTMMVLKEVETVDSDNSDGKKFNLAI